MIHRESKATGGWKHTQDGVIVGGIGKLAIRPTVNVHLPVASRLEGSQAIMRIEPSNGSTR